ncbi:MAG: divergent polysaccharide deacetylase family protein [Pseudomonadota bacterium]
MLKDDLRMPLERRTLRDRLGLSAVTPLRIATCAVLAGNLALFGWLGLNHDPLGGEPVVTIKMLPGDPVLTAAAQSKVETEPVEQKPEKGTVRVFGGGDEPRDVPSGVKTIKVGSTSKVTRIEGSGELSALDRQFGDLVPEGPEEQVLHTGSIAKAVRLRRAPLRKLVEKTVYGPLPKVSGSLTPAKAYARPVDKAQAKKLRGRIALVIGGMGISSEATRRAIARLPGPVSLAFAPYGAGMQRWIRKARRGGHEVLLQLPMEPFNYPATSPGPNPLLTSLQPAENLSRLKGFMGKFTGYTGVVNYMGARFTSDVGAFGPVLAELKRRGLTYLDDGTSARSKAREIGRQFGLGVAQAVSVIDHSPDPVRIRSNLERLEAIALQKGVAIAVGSALPGTITEVSQWANTLHEKGLGLIPVSAVY